MKKSSLILMVFLLTSAAVPFRAGEAAEVQAASEGGTAIKPKGPVALVPQNVTKAEGTATTTFHFHPEATVSTGYKKDSKTLAITDTLNPFTHNYPTGELHKSTGSATYTLVLASPAANKFTIGGTVAATITPGAVVPPKEITIDAAIADPFVFSSSPNAQFEFLPDGIDVAFTLGSATAFPALFAPDLQSFGAVASDTSIEFEVRVAPGSISDPNVFWSDGLSGAIDLFTLLITSDSNHVIHVVLTYGTSSVDFLVDSHSLSEKADIESAIAAHFNADGSVSSDLTDFLTVGFVPAGGISAYTFGISNTLRLAGVEVPEPATIALLILGLAGLGFRNMGIGDRLS